MENKKHYFSDPEEGQNAFDQLAERFYKKNFGQMSKADIEVLMFSIYIEHAWKVGEPDEDLDLAEKLGVPESKIRRLKVQKELNYPRKDSDWIDAFLKYARYATYDDNDRLVRISIPDPNVKRHVEAKIEEKHWQFDNSFNRKMLKMRADHFLGLCIELSEDKKSFNQDEAIKKLKESAANMKDLDSRGLVELIRNRFKGMTKEELHGLPKEGISLLLKALQAGGLIIECANVIV